MSLKIELYDNEGNVISVEDSRDLAAEKQKLTEAVNMHRQTYLDGTIWFMGHEWDTDEVSRSNITGAVTALAVGITLPSNFVWRDHNNNNVPMNAQSMVGLGGYAMQWVNTVYGYSWALKASINACTDLDQIDAIDIYDPAYWPDNNMDGSKPS